MSSIARARYLLFFGIFNLGTYFLIQQYVANEYSFMTPLDQAIPFIDWTVWLYHTLIPGIVLTMFLLVRTRRVFFNVFWAAILGTIIIHVCYIMFPSFYPRPEITGSGVTHFLVDLSYKIDNSSNTFPSGHVTFAWLMFWGSMNSKVARGVLGLRRLYFLWALGISLSTLTLKMHYVVDVVGGFAVAASCFFIVKAIIRKYNLYNEKT